MGGEGEELRVLRPNEITCSLRKLITCNILIINFFAFAFVFLTQ